MVKYIRDGTNIMKAGNARLKEHPKTIFQLQRIVVQNKHSYIVMLYVFEKITRGNTNTRGRTGLLSYPEDIQRLIIKARHFPLPTLEVYPLVYLYLKDAISPEKSIPVRGKEEEIKKLLRQGKIGNVITRV